MGRESSFMVGWAAAPRSAKTGSLGGGNDKVGVQSANSSFMDYHLVAGSHVFKTE